MADSSHLEKMGRELKCPICLSLLNSAASLGCNHVFCNTCIEKSMKSGSNCPVCKVPYRRREVRPAPHMDNLVSIYKSMETASGINIFVTQNLPPAKLSDDGDKQVEGDGNCSKRLDAEISDIGAGKQRTSKKGQLKIKKSSQKSSASSPGKPSFPRKKRVQVPQCPLSETPTRHAKLASIYNKMNDEELRKNAVVLGDKGEPVLSPFFWLKGDEEDDEKSSQHFDWDQPTGSMTVNVPSFSDIKDSLDESPFKTPMEEVCGKPSSDLDFLDSEMFEWTQRPCSPELCSSPFKRQVEDSATIDSTETTKLEVASNKEPRKEYPNENSNQSGCIPGLAVPDGSPQETNNMKNQSGSQKLEKRGRKKKEIALKKCVGKCTESVRENSVKKTKCMSQKQECEVSNRNSLKTYTKRSNRAHSGIDRIMETLEEVRAVPIRLETSIGGPEKFGTETSAFPEEEKISEFPKKSCKKAGVQKAVDCRKRSKKRKLDSVGNKLLEEQSLNQNQTDNCAVPNLTTSTSAIAMSTSRKKGDMKQPKSTSFGSITVKEYDDIIQETHVDTQAKHNQLSGKRQCNTDSMSKKVHLQNCERLDNEFCCAFCHSSIESEASGRMVHYFNGKPTDANESNEVKNSRVVHAHWNCVEWAPNVYFDGDNAKNLEAELNRSRRIKCSCCGIKGAALGCYEKSCRKSFHVPCAKLMPQCQWDTNNFVMLCPLHPDSKLPIQDMGHQERKKKCTPKRQSSTKYIAVAPEISNNGNFNFRESPKKMVLCCSALTTPEKEAVLDFQRLSGVTMLQKWDDSVTHIVASIDENGACKRTLKIMMGILKGKWILSIEWIKACKQAMEAVEEESYEITLDVHGIRDGPRLGRLRVLNNQPKLFAGFNFFFTADFTPSYKGYLQELVTAAGGTVLLRKPVSNNQNTSFSSSSNCQVLIIYSLEPPDNCVPGEKNKILNRRRSDAKLLAHSASAKVATNSWLLNSIAGSKLERLAE